MSAKDTRLQKYLSECGETSRRKAEDWIRAGRVQVNGRPAHLGQSVDSARDRVTVDGRLVEPKPKLYLALNKPRGYVTTLSDELERRCVVDLLKDIKIRVYPIGRLDKDSEGLLLFTDDGAFANALTHPRHHVPKTYHVSVRPRVVEEQVAQLTLGVVIDGRKTLPAKVSVLRSGSDRSVLELVLYEGRNRQIRKMCEAVGLEVARLSRVSVGNVRLGGLHSGHWRELSEKEVRGLERAAGLRD
ncbi:MAG TPA: pseudouridine synthase [Ruminococcaceae bacterium]|nr:pseudouridine synthase [Oscillospiraceae bacterium]